MDGRRYFNARASTAHLAYRSSPWIPEVYLEYGCLASIDLLAMIKSRAGIKARHFLKYPFNFTASIAASGLWPGLR